jgi:hypothetical protein
VIDGERYFGKTSILGLKTPFCRRKVWLKEKGFVLKETAAPFRPLFDGQKDLLREENRVYLNE